jgi:hypothetical protein
VPRPSKYQGRAGRVTRSANDGRFWDTNFETIYRLSSGVIVTKTDYFNDQGLGSKLNHEVIDAVSARRYCERAGCNNAEIKVDHRGFAYCPVCKHIFNDGVPPMRQKTSDLIIKKSRVIGHNEITKSRKHFLEKISH